MEAKKAKRGVVYTTKEDELFCLAWLGNSVDPFVGAEQRGVTLLRKVCEFFYGMKNYPSYHVVKIGDWSENSFNHRNKYCGAYAQIKNRAPSVMGPSGMGIVELVSFASHKVHHMIYLPYVAMFFIM